MDFDTSLCAGGTVEISRWFHPSASTQVLVREADASIKPRVERVSAQPWVIGRQPVKPTQWAAAIDWRRVENGRQLWAGTNAFAVAHCVG